jgi:hypothetical protein
LPDLAAEVAFDGPVLVIVGSVVGLRDRLAWFGEAEPEKAPAEARREYQDH